MSVCASCGHSDSTHRFLQAGLVRACEPAGAKCPCSGSWVPLPAPGRKDDQAKPRYDLMPLQAERHVVDVLTYGAKKYAPENWRHVPDARARYHAAARRHLAAWAGGEQMDPESGLPHLAHAACCILFLLETP